MEQKEALLKNLTDTISLLADISAAEEEKFQAAIQKKILVMEEIIKKEQALLLHSKGLEQKRAQLLKQMGAENLTLRQYIETLPAEERPPFQESFDALSAAIQVYQKVHHRTKTIIEANLHRINTELERLSGTPLGGSEGGYSEHGEMRQGAKPFTSRKI